MKRFMVSLGLVWFALFGGSKTSAADDEAYILFAADEIKPSEMTFFMIDRLFRGRMKPVPATHQRRLDQALVHGDWRHLEEAITTLENEVGIEAALNWQATRHIAGYLAISMRYALYSFAVGSADDQNRLKEFSVIAWFYILAAIKTDGYKCRDWSGPRTFLDHVQSNFTEIRAFATSLPVDRLQQFQRLALYLEEGIAPDRVTDPILCSYGMPPSLSALQDQRNKTLQEGGAAVDPDDDWRVEAAQTRARLPETMEQILSVLKG